MVGNELSVAFDLKLDASGVMGVWELNFDQDNNNMLSLAASGSGIQFERWTDSQSSVDWALIEPKPTVGSWHRFLLTVNANGKLTVYQDGEVVAISSGTATPLPSDPELGYHFGVCNVNCLTNEFSGGFRQLYFFEAVATWREAILHCSWPGKAYNAEFPYSESLSSSRPKCPPTLPQATSIALSVVPFPTDVEQRLLDFIIDQDSDIDGLRIKIKADGVLSFSFWDSNAQVAEVLSDAALQPLYGYRLLATISESGDMALYVDEVQQGTTQSTGTPLRQAIRTLAVGGDFNDEQGAHGLILDLFVFNGVVDWQTAQPPRPAPECIFDGWLFNGDASLDWEHLCDKQVMPDSLSVAFTFHALAAPAAPATLLWYGTQDPAGGETVYAQLLPSGKLTFHAVGRPDNGTSATNVLETAQSYVNQSVRVMVRQSYTGYIELITPTETLFINGPPPSEALFRKMVLGGDYQGEQRFTGSMEDVWAWSDKVTINAAVGSWTSFCDIYASATGNAMTFDGSNAADWAEACRGPDYAGQPNNMGTSFSMAFTMTTDTAGSERVVAEFVAGGDVLSVLLAADGRLIWRHAIAGTGTAEVETAASVVGGEHRFLLVAGNSGYLQLFMDGVKEIEGQGPSVAPGMLQRTGTLGGKAGADGLVGSLQDVMFWAAKVAWEDTAHATSTTSSMTTSTGQGTTTAESTAAETQAAGTTTAVGLVGGATSEGTTAAGAETSEVVATSVAGTVAMSATQADTSAAAATTAAPGLATSSAALADVATDAAVATSAAADVVTDAGVATSIAAVDTGAAEATSAAAAMGTGAAEATSTAAAGTGAAIATSAAATVGTGAAVTTSAAATVDTGAAVATSIAAVDTGAAVATSAAAAVGTGAAIATSAAAAAAMTTSVATAATNAAAAATTTGAAALSASAAAVATSRAAAVTTTLSPATGSTPTLAGLDGPHTTEAAIAVAAATSPARSSSSTTTTTAELASSTSTTMTTATTRTSTVTTETRTVPEPESTQVLKAVEQETTRLLDLLVQNNESRVTEAIEGGTMTSARLDAPAAAEDFLSVSVPTAESEVKQGIEVRLPTAVFDSLLEALAPGEKLAMVVTVPDSPEKLGGGDAEGNVVGVSAAVVIDIATLAGGTLNVSQLTKPIEFSLPVAYSPELTCAYWDELKEVWSTEGVSLSGDAAAGEAIRCATWHLSLFGAIFAGFIQAFLCSQLKLLNWESIQEMAASAWYQTPGGVLYWSLLGLMLLIFLASAVIDWRRSEEQKWRPEFFLIPMQDSATPPPPEVEEALEEKIEEEEEKEEADEWTVKNVGYILSFIVACMTTMSACCRETALRDALDEIAGEYFEQFGEVRNMIEGIWQGLEVGAVSSGRLVQVSQAVARGMVITSARRLVGASMGLSSEVVCFVLEDKELLEMLQHHKQKMTKVYRASWEEDKPFPPGSEEEEFEAQSCAPMVTYLAPGEAKVLRESQPPLADEAVKGKSVGLGDLEGGQQPEAANGDEAPPPPPLGSWEASRQQALALRASGASAATNSWEADEDGVSTPGMVPKCRYSTPGVTTPWYSCEKREDAWAALHDQIVEHMESHVAEHSWCSVPRMVFGIFMVHNPVGSIVARNIFMSCKMRALFQMLELVGDLLVVCIFYSSSGAVKGKPRGGKKEATCGDPDLQEDIFYKMGRILAVATGAILIAGLPVSFLKSLHTRNFKKLPFEGCDAWGKQLLTWRVQDMMIWFFGILYFLFAMWFVALFLANISFDDHEDWTTTGIISLVQDAILMPLLIAIFMPTLAAMMLSGMTVAASTRRSHVIREINSSVSDSMSVGAPAEGSIREI